MTPTTACTRLSSPRFLAFLATQFLGAANDNAYKAIIVAFTLREFTDEATQTRYGNLVSLLLPVPFLLFSPLAGHVADRFAKHRVLLATKAPEILSMALATLAIARESVPAMLAVFFLMATQSAFFGPAKYGLLPELFSDADLSRANGVLNMTTNVAILTGMGSGLVLFHACQETPLVLGGTLTAVAVAGTVLAAFVPPGRPGDALATPALNPLRVVARDVATVRAQPVLGHSVLGVAYFGFLGAVFLVLTPIFGSHGLGLPEAAAQGLLAVLAVAVAVGSLLAGRLSHRRVEIGLVPLGAVGLSAFALDLTIAAGPGAGPAIDLPLLGAVVVPWRALVDLGAIGTFSGFFIVPLLALVQQRAPEREKGRIIAFANLASFAGVLLASGFLWALSSGAGLDSRQVLLALALLTLGGTAWTLALVPDFFVRLVLYLLTSSVYRIRVLGEERIPRQGALLACNHVTWVDAFLVAAASGRMVRFMMYRPYYETRALNWFFKRMHVIPIAATDRPGQTKASFELARSEVRAGHVVCIFAEGSITRTGNLLRFRRGLERIMEGVDAPIVPVYLHGLWGSIFSFEGGRFLLKRPRRIPYPVTVAFGRPLPADTDAPRVRRAVQELSAETFAEVQPEERPVHVEFLRHVRRGWRRPFLADSTGRSVSFGRALAGALALRDALFADPDDAEHHLGILLPPGVPAALVNLATLASGRVPVNLNYTASAEALASAVERAELRRVVTSRRFLEKLGAPGGLEGAEQVLLEDLSPRVRRARALLLSLLPLVLPMDWAARLLYRGELRDVGATLTVLFSSGSTGSPKGVVLSHHNVRSNIAGLMQVFSLTSEHAILGVLPFFHSFGFTATLALPLAGGLRAVFHANPLDARTVGKLARRHAATVLLATPTFLAAYARRLKREDFASLRLVVVGAERLGAPLRSAFEEKFGIEVLEGYGCTECSPIVSVNAPDVAEGRRKQVAHRPGSIGLPLPGVTARIVHPESGAEVPLGEEGLLLVKGPNVMQGYLGEPGRTSEVLSDGWYVTGDVATLDEDGFLTITDRLSRFAKIAGEMVPLGRVEEAVLAAAGETAPAGDEGPPACVTAVPDDRKGERIVVLYRKGALDPDAVVEALADSGLPNLWLPARSAFREVPAIPLLGTGKLDLRRARELASA